MPNEMLTKLIPAIKIYHNHRHIQSPQTSQKKKSYPNMWESPFWSKHEHQSMLWSNLPASIAIMITPHWCNNDDCCVGFDNNVKCIDGERGGGEEILDGGLVEALAGNVRHPTIHHWILEVIGIQFKHPPLYVKTQSLKSWKRKEILDGGWGEALAGNVQTWYLSNLLHKRVYSQYENLPQ